jgi:porin
MNLQIRNVFAVAALMAAGFPHLALAQDSTASADAKPATEDMWTRDQLTGDWGGLRSDLTKYGIDIDLRLSQYWQGVTSGGRDEHDEYGGTMDYQVNLDGPKLFGSWEGFSVNIHARTRWGDDINAEAGELVIPNTGLLMPAPGNYHDTDITGFIASQYLPFNGGLANVTLGKLDVIDTVNLFFPEVASGQEGFMNMSSMVSAMPWFGAVRGLSLYGGYAVAINQEFMSPSTGLLVTGTENVSTTNGQLADSFEDGVWIAGFHRFFWKMDDKAGHFMVFAGASTADQVTNIELTHVKIPGAPGTDYLIPEIESDREKPWDVALYLHQRVWQADGDPSRRVYVMIAGTAGPDDPQFSQYNVFGHVEFLGLMDSRPHDKFGAAVWWNSLSDNYQDVVSFLDEDLQDLYGFELYYNYQIMPSVHLTADLQYAQNEWKEDDMAVIAAGRLVIDF